MTFVHCKVQYPWCACSPCPVVPTRGGLHDVPARTARCWMNWTGWRLQENISAHIMCSASLNRHAALLATTQHSAQHAASQACTLLLLTTPSAAVPLRAQPAQARRHACNAGAATISTTSTNLCCSQQHMLRLLLLPPHKQVCAAVAHMHSRGFAHFDVKPHNVLLRRPRPRPTRRHWDTVSRNALAAGAAATVHNDDELTALADAEAGVNRVRQGQEGAGAAAARSGTAGTTGNTCTTTAAAATTTAAVSAAVTASVCAAAAAVAVATSVLCCNIHSIYYCCMWVFVFPSPPLPIVAARWPRRLHCCAG